MSLKQVYEAIGMADTGRIGYVHSDDEKCHVEIDLPKSVGGKGEKSNPEQLFACGYAACFSSIALYTCKRWKLNVESLPVTVKVKLYNEDTNPFAFHLKVEIHAWIKDVSQEDAEKIIKEAHHNCAYSNIVKDGVVEKLFVNDKEIML
ncbi:Ohr family peroxiredoxin [Mycoplasmoides alvi]|uniref:Ohr family peroxiredoxin n=1 Tax=Mycoplasmoides alvi TaxID=78580 RepID=UPI000696CD6C|nr:Ohr family peroxiredoxin [Mycoplasmoides alvi]